MFSSKTPIYLVQQIREFERLAEERFHISGQVMMQRAGHAAFDFLSRRFPQAQKIAVFCGSGNNGGDGYVIAQLAHERGLKVTVWQVGQQENMKEEAKQAFAACQKAGVAIFPFDEKIDLTQVDLLVDAILGIGVHDLVRDDIVTVIEKMQHTQLPIFSIDVPSGVDADTGQILGTAIHASATMTFIGLKLGLLTGSGTACIGELALNNLQLPTELFSHIEPSAEKIQLSSYAAYLKPRARDWHKGLSGRVLVIGGDEGFSGAPRMAAEAALRVGAGLVSVVTRTQYAAIMNVNCPEIMCRGIEHPEELAPLLAKTDVIVLGPGLGQSAWSHAIWETIAKQTRPMVVDADGLNLLAASKDNASHENWVLTPHPGEAARLLNTTVSAIQQDRLGTVKALQKRYGGVVLLKGAGSLVAAPNSLPALCDKGNPGMATGGMGDVLSGVIGGLIAQSIPLGEAAKLGMCLHAAAGDMAAKEGERGTIATDLLPYLRRLSNTEPNVK